MSLQSVISDIEKQFKKENHKLYEPFIRYIRFPKYKSLLPNSRIDFNFPLTVLVGGNGTNKTSILQALYGCPSGKSVGRYWFSTKLDVIQDGKTPYEKNCYIYSYFHKGAKKDVECLKTRVQRKDNTDYWEPSRAIEDYQMRIPDENELIAAGQKVRTRWDLIQKNVRFLDCKEYISAYDLFFYHSNFKKTKKINTRQDFIRNRSKQIFDAIENNLDRKEYYGRNCIEYLETLSKNKINIINDIIGKKYKKIHVLSHSFYSKGSFNKPAKTILIEEEGLNYSEAFAGSGESRIILLVNDILKADKHSLILIDEPEISLHPEAIEKFKIFLLQEILKNQHQVIISTHSSNLVRGLPKESIKLLSFNTGKINIIQDVEYSEAFYDIGERIENKNIIFVEDKLSKYIVEYFFTKKMENRWTDKFAIQIAPGGVDTIITQSIFSAAISNQKNIYFVLDGDRNFFPYTHDKNGNKSCYEIKKSWCNCEKICEREIPSSVDCDLDKILKTITGNSVKIKANGKRGKSHEEEKIAMQRNFLKFWESNVQFLPSSSPEKAILESLPNKVEVEDGKAFFEKEANLEIDGTPDSSDIFNLEKRYLAKCNQDSLIHKKMDIIIERIVRGETGK